MAKGKLQLNNISKERSKCISISSPISDGKQENSISIKTNVKSNLRSPTRSCYDDIRLCRESAESAHINGHKVDRVNSNKRVQFILPNENSKMDDIEQEEQKQERVSTPYDDTLTRANIQRYSRFGRRLSLPLTGSQEMYSLNPMPNDYASLGTMKKERSNHYGPSMSNGSPTLSKNNSSPTWDNYSVRDNVEYSNMKNSKKKKRPKISASGRKVTKSAEEVQEVRLTSCLSRRRSTDLQLYKERKSTKNGTFNSLEPINVEPNEMVYQMGELADRFKNIEIRLQSALEPKEWGKAPRNTSILDHFTTPSFSPSPGPSTNNHLHMPPGVRRGRRMSLPARLGKSTTSPRLQNDTNDQMAFVANIQEQFVKERQRRMEEENQSPTQLSLPCIRFKF